MTIYVLIMDSKFNLFWSKQDSIIAYNKYCITFSCKHAVLYDLYIVGWGVCYLGIYINVVKGRSSQSYYCNTVRCMKNKLALQ